MAFVAVAAGVASAAGCGSSTKGGAGGSSASSSTKSSSSSTSNGSSSGSVASSGTTSSTSSGGKPACLAASAYAGLFTISDKAFCAVAVYTASESLASSSWGSHGGPLSFTADAVPDGGASSGVTVQRWTPPAGAMGAMTSTTTDVPADVPSGAYVNPVVDLPFFSWTAISWTGPGTATTGTLAPIANGAVATTYAVNGIFSVAGISAGAGQGRLLYTGLSPLGTPATDTNGLYAADACSAPMDELGAGTGCSPSQLIDGWDEASGPVAVDSSGNAFAVLTSFSAGTQEARGYASAQVARGAPAVKGTTLFTVAGYSGDLVALAPTSSASGLLVFQPIDSTTNDALDVVEQAYTVSGGVVTATDVQATLPTLLTVPPGMTSLILMNDTTDRLWVGVPSATSTTYVVLSRSP